MTKPSPNSDPSIRVNVNMPASLYQRLREHADANGTTVGNLCREGASRSLAVEPPVAS